MWKPNKEYKRRLSKSALQTFQQCPEKFQFTHVLGLKDPSGPEAMIGQYIHKSFADFYQTLDLDKLKTPMDLVADIMRYDSGGMREHFINFASFNVGRYKKLKKFGKEMFMKPLLSEEKIQHPDLELVGIVDAVFQDEKGDIIVLDYKTGKYHPERITDYRMELSIYTELVARTTSYVPTHWGIFFTKSGMFWQEKIQPKYFNDVVLPLIAKAKKAVDSGIFEPKIGPLCMWCSLKSSCSAWGGPKDPILIEQLKKAKDNIKK